MLAAVQRIARLCPPVATCGAESIAKAAQLQQAYRPFAVYFCAGGGAGGGIQPDGIADGKPDGNVVGMPGGNGG
jgi:hypothetical protein